MGRDGRRQRLDPDPAAGTASTDVRRLRSRRSGHDHPLPRLGRDVRSLTKTDLPENTALPRIEVDPDTFTVRIDGDVVEPTPAQTLPLTQRYFLF